MDLLHSNASFMPHGYCFLWRPDILWLNLISNSVIAFSYFSIPIVLLLLLKKRRNRIEMPGILVLFAAFIVSCGINHVMEVWTLWHPQYWIAGLLKAVTAITSLYTALTLIARFDQLVQMPTVADVRQAFRQLEVSEERFRGLAKWAPLGIAMMDTGGDVIFANDWYQDVTGRSLETLLKNGWQDMVHPEDLKRISEYMTTAPGDADEWIEYRVLHQGTTRWLRGIMKPIYSPTQGLTGFISVDQDITFTKEAEDRIKQTNTALQQALNFDAMLRLLTDKLRRSLDEDEIIQTAVKGLTLLLGALSCDAAIYDLELGTATIRQDFFVNGQSNVGATIELAQYAEVYDRLMNDELVIFCPIAGDPLRGKISLLAAPICDQHGAIGSLQLANHEGYCFSETEKRLICQVASQCGIAIRQARLYRKVHDQVLQLERAGRLKDEFLSTVSHELRTPVSNMKMAIKMVETVHGRLCLANCPAIPGATSVSERLEKYISILGYECQREIDLINDLLDLQRLECGQQPLDLQEVNLLPLLSDLSNSFLSRFQERDQRFELCLEHSLPVIYSDQSDLNRIVSELLNNACKYTPAGETIRLTAAVHSGMLLIQVINSGVVIADEHLPHLFDKFYRGVGSSDPWKAGGTGLGLALIRKLCQKLGGSVEVQSNHNQTCFSVYLPLPAPVALVAN